MQICGRGIASIVRKVFTGLKINVGLVHRPIEPVNMWSYNAWYPFERSSKRVGYHALNTSRPTLIAHVIPQRGC